MVKGAEFRGAESEMCGLTFGCSQHFELHPLPTPRKWGGSFTLLEGSKGPLKVSS